jgi:hypothetical protein
MAESFPAKPKGMHWRTYQRLRRAHDIAAESSMVRLVPFVDRLRRRGGIKF